MSVALFVILVHKLENHFVMELYASVTFWIAPFFNSLKRFTTSVLICPALVVTFDHISWNHFFTDPTMLEINSVARCVIPENKPLIVSNVLEVKPLISSHTVDQSPFMMAVAVLIIV